MLSSSHGISHTPQSTEGEQVTLAGTLPDPDLVVAVPLPHTQIPDTKDG
jgi:hypothetical protein